MRTGEIIWPRVAYPRYCPYLNRFVYTVETRWRYIALTAFKHRAIKNIVTTHGVFF